MRAKPKPPPPEPESPTNWQGTTAPLPSTSPEPPVNPIPPLPTSVLHPLRSPRRRPEAQTQKQRQYLVPRRRRETLHQESGQEAPPLHRSRIGAAWLSGHFALRCQQGPQSGRFEETDLGQPAGHWSLQHQRSLTEQGQCRIRPRHHHPRLPRRSHRQHRRLLLQARQEVH